jgi:hypothetical protein
MEPGKKKRQLDVQKISLISYKIKHSSTKTYNFQEYEKG